MKTIKDLQQMIKEPASKEWFAKHGTPHSSARDAALKRKVNAGTGRRLTKEEQAFKTKDWPKGDSKGSVAWPKTDKQKRDHQTRFGRAWND